MGEVRDLADSLKNENSIEYVSPSAYVVAFNVDHGEYDALTPSVISLLAEYGASVYVDDRLNEDYWAVV